MKQTCLAGWWSGDECECERVMFEVPRAARVRADVLTVKINMERYTVHTAKLYRSRAPREVYAFRFAPRYLEL